MLHRLQVDLKLVKALLVVAFSKTAIAMPPWLYERRTMCML
jgi:hypothetical protein